MLKLEGGLKVKGLFDKKTREGKPLISIVTPVYNGEKYLEETIQSIIAQTYDNIEYIIIDGKSTDRTMDIIRKYENRIAYWLSEPDKGMYDAIKKGFKVATGEIFAWLNSDDKYYQSAVEVIAKTFKKYPEVEWVTGIPTIYDETGLIVRVGGPLFYFNKFFRMGLYRGDILGWLQQESTFWRKSLWERVGGINNSLKFAGDYDLWIRFSKQSHIYVIPTILGGFRSHSSQKSKEIEGYYAECDAIKKIMFKRFWQAIRHLIRISSILMAVNRRRKEKVLLKE